MSASRPVRLGWKKEPPSDKDHDAAPLLRSLPAPPLTASNRRYIIDVLDQGALGSCTANAVTQAIRAAHAQQGIANPKLGSRLMSYYLGRAQQGPAAIGIDDGTYLRSVLHGDNQFGFCPEEAWPYDVSKFAEMPPANAFRLAIGQRGGEGMAYKKIMSTGQSRVNDIKIAIAAGFCIVFGTEVSERFCANNLGTGPIEPPKSEPIAGGHALCGAEYDQDGLSIPNSWSIYWGDRGWCKISWSYVMWAMTTDIWMISKPPVYVGALAA